MALRFTLKVQPRQTLDRSTAWACLVSNTLVLPGMGSLLAGRRSGYIQMALAGIGVVLTLAFAVWFLQALVQPVFPPDNLGHWLWLGLLGFVAFFGSWLWALGTSLFVLKESRPDDSE